MLGIVQPGGVDEVCVLAAELLGAFIHVVDKGVHRAVHRLSQDVAGLVCRDDQHAAEQLLHGQRFTGFDVGGAAAGNQTDKGALLRGDGGVQRKLALVDRFKYQQRDHDFCQTGGIIFLMAVFIIQNLPGVRLHQQRSLCLDLDRLIGCGLRAQHQRDKQGEDQKK